MRKIAILLGVLLASSALADPNTVNIVAVVNDQVISSSDLNDRVALIMTLTGIPDTLENRTKFSPQILHQLIDEKLEMQDAAAHSITVPDTRLHESITKIEQQNGKTPGSLEAFVNAKHLSKNSFYDQVRAQTAWSELVNKQIKPQVHISDQEVERYKLNTHPAATVKPGAVKEEVMINVILLPVDSPARDAAVGKVAAKLADEIRAGAHFEDVAAQFSASSGRAKAPEAFWVERGQLDPMIGAALAKITKGGVTDPVKTEAGYQLIKLVDTRENASAGATAPSKEAPPAALAQRSEFAFKQIIMTPKPTAKIKKQDDVLKLAQKLAVNPGKCTEKTVNTTGDLLKFNYEVSMVRRLSTNLPLPLVDMLRKLKVGATSQPIATPEGVRLFTLCERMDLPPEKPATSSDASTPAPDGMIRQKIFEEKIELEVQKYLRNLRKEAFIEVRQQ